MIRNSAPLTARNWNGNIGIFKFEPPTNQIGEEREGERERLDTNVRLGALFDNQQQQVADLTHLKIHYMFIFSQWLTLTVEYDTTNVIINTLYQEE